MLELILITLSLLVLMAASCTDLKTREVPDWLNYGFLAAGLGIRTIYSFQEGWSTLLSGVLGLVVAFLLGSIFYLTHQWGGGDTKLLAGLGAMIGISYPFSPASLELGWFLLALLFVGALYGLVWMIVIFFQKKQQVSRHFRFLLGEYKGIHIASGGAAAFFAFASIPLPFLWPLVLFPLVLFYLFLFVESVEQTSFFKDVAISTLTEGDWLAEDIFIDGRRVVKSTTLGMKELTTLNRLKTEGRLKTVLIKEGLPFVPSFLLAYLLVKFGGEGVAIIWQGVWG
ncbi:MAG: A24 family peptidase [Nanoarchaeota archaeon]